MGFGKKNKGANGGIPTRNGFMEMRGSPFSTRGAAGHSLGAGMGPEFVPACNISQRDGEQQGGERTRRHGMGDEGTERDMVADISTSITRKERMISREKGKAISGR